MLIVSVKSHTPRIIPRRECESVGEIQCSETDRTDMVPLVEGESSKAEEEKKKAEEEAAQKAEEEKKAAEEQARQQAEQQAQQQAAAEEAARQAQQQAEQQQAQQQTAPPSIGTVRGGSFCSSEGSTGTSSAGNILTCRVASDGRLRWMK
ncbi:hypothetical protein [Bifidobacterium breve]|uniref:hypothetical protein n=1 Tax=Bifidobacterium breve TaxID=1685 RepID=UPI00298BCB7A|nr:hypothetical protein [Bifidobacterium breve]